MSDERDFWIDRCERNFQVATFWRRAAGALFALAMLSTVTMAVMVVREIMIDGKKFNGEKPTVEMDEEARKSMGRTMEAATLTFMGRDGEPQVIEGFVEAESEPCVLCQGLASDVCTACVNRRAERAIEPCASCNWPFERGDKPDIIASRHELCLVKARDNAERVSTHARSAFDDAVRLRAENTTLRGEKASAHQIAQDSLRREHQLRVELKRMRTILDMVVRKDPNTEQGRIAASFDDLSAPVCEATTIDLVGIAERARRAVAMRLPSVALHECAARDVPGLVAEVRRLGGGK